MKKLLLGIALVLMASSSFAQVKLTFEPASFELKAGEIQEITVSLEGAAVDQYKGLSMTLEMPDNLDLVPYNLEDIEEDPEEPAVMLSVILPSSSKTQRGAFEASADYTFYRKGHQYTVHDDETDTEVPGRVSDRDELNVVFYNTKGYTFPKKEVDSEELFSFQIKATDKCYTETSSFDAQVVYTTATSESEKANYAEAAKMTYSIEYTLPAGGFGTIAWPVALDFSKNNFTAVGTGRLNGTSMLINEGATKFAATEPVIIFGEQGTYNLYTTRDEVAKDADNVLEGTPDEPLKVSENNVYALADKGENGIGFFRCKEGVEIPQYKAYYHSNDASVDAFIFEGTSGIREAVAGNDASDAYTISGVKVNNTSKKGVYIVNGKKVVVK